MKNEKPILTHMLSQKCLSKVLKQDTNQLIWSDQ